MAANSAPPIPPQASLPTPQCQWTFLLTELSSLLFYWRALFMVCHPEGCDVHYSNSTFRNISRSFLHSGLYRIFLKKERSSKKEVSYSNRNSHDAPCNFGMSAWVPSPFATSWIGLHSTWWSISWGPWRHSFPMILDKPPISFSRNYHIHTLSWTGYCTLFKRCSVTAYWFVVGFQVGSLIFNDVE